MTRKVLFLLVLISAGLAAETKAPVAPDHRMVERASRKLYPKQVKRLPGGVLVLNSAKGNEVTRFQNGSRRYYFRDYHLEKDLFVVVATQGDDTRVILVLGNGQKLEVDAYPVFSPDFQRIVIFSNTPGRAELAIYRFSATAFDREASFSPQAGDPAGSASWLDNSTVQVQSQGGSISRYALQPNSIWTLAPFH